MDKSNFTINAYDENAEKISIKFRSLGARVEDIERAIALRGKDTDLNVVELGAGDGRDAAEIIKRVDSYIGVEPSKGLLKIAWSFLPEVSFVQETAQSYHFPDTVDIVFAFASLLHVDKVDMQVVLHNIYESLSIGGILFLSLKEASEYTELLINDIWGMRQFYLYSKENIVDMAGSHYKSVYEDHQLKGDTEWLTLALKKVS